ncbi:MAG: hypothetical protein RR614_12520, partial [Eubacterium sp.]
MKRYPRYVPIDYAKFAPEIPYHACEANYGLPLRIPHVGWNGLYPVDSAQFSSILAPLTPGDETYF